MPRLILGTAGHIDHGKTELVRALTGVDTDRLQEEKERGITIDLGFAELADDETQLGVVDVPGHEGFIRNMLAGATGMDMVLLVIAADEGVMPQTREHLAIVTLLGVERLVVALSKADLVEDEWLELVTGEVTELLQSTPYEGAPMVPTSSRTAQGIAELIEELRRAARGLDREEVADLARLPIDRVFTIRGTGTVVTGTLWTGRMSVGERVRILPGNVRGRVRGLEVHGRAVHEVSAGQRVAVAISGPSVGRETLARGQTLVADDAWAETSMLTALVSVLPGSPWMLERGQRVRLHAGTSEVMARAVLLEEDALPPGESGWAQLRLEAPVVVRARERFVLRSYSPVTTFGGGVVAEPVADKRKRLAPLVRELLAAVVRGGEAALAARARLAGLAGEPASILPVTTGLPKDLVDGIVGAVPEVGEGNAAHGLLRISGSILDASLLSEHVERLVEAVEQFHEREPLRTGMAVDTLRSELPRQAHPDLADALLRRLEATGQLQVRAGLVRRTGFVPTPTEPQVAALEALDAVYRDSGLAPPFVPELPDSLRRLPELWPLLLLRESDGTLKRLGPELFIWSAVLRGAVEQVRLRLGGRSALGPSDFREVLPVTRKHLIPLLTYLDLSGVTVRTGGSREVPPI